MTTKATEAARLLGRKGGKARAESVPAEERRKWSVKGGETRKAQLAEMTPQERSQRARDAAQARWAKRNKETP